MGMKKAAQGIFVLLLGLISPAALYATDMTITADFTPSVADPSNNQFINTTPQSGYCTTRPDECATNKTLSIAFPVTASLTGQILAHAEPRKSMFFKMPGALRTVTVTNTANGQTAQVQFRVKGFSASYGIPGDINAWVGGNFVNAPKPCNYGGIAWVNSSRFTFMWKWPQSDEACYKISTIDRGDQPARIYDMSIGYELTTPNPLILSSGLYQGTLSFRIGPGGEIDFGDNYQPSDSVLNINFKLSVNHELKITLQPGTPEIALQPCTPGKICNEAEGLANWERWMVTNLTPLALTGRRSFDISSSGAFTVFLNCQYQAGEHCGIKSDNTNRVVPVQSLLTLPTHIYDTSGNAVTRRRLYPSKDTSRNLFFSRAFSTGSPGYIDFEIARKDIDAMLVNRPDNYSGVVTVIFDPDVF